MQVFKVKTYTVWDAINEELVGVYLDEITALDVADALCRENHYDIGAHYSGAETSFHGYHEDTDRETIARVIRSETPLTHSSALYIHNTSEDYLHAEAVANEILRSAS